VSGHLLDTNVLSELIRKHPEPSVLDRLQAAEGNKLATSVICVTELRYGAARHPEGDRLWQRIAAEVLPRVQVLPLDYEKAVRGGSLLADLATRGEPIGIEDVLIAATALELDLTVVTRNLRHFRRIEGLKAESWWRTGA
jgi:tRNA(fMet)-specific endonuclease VapC